MAGSDLHHYRGLDDGRDYIMGHEVLGEVVEVGKGVTKFQKGDLVVSPFSASCGQSSFPSFSSGRDGSAAVRAVSRPAPARSQC